MTQTSHDTCAAFIGIDWADAKHDGCLQATGSAKRACFQLAHTPEAIDAWVTTLRTRFDGQPVALCLELNKGPLVCALRKDDFLVLCPIKPLTLARYREAFTPSRAKDDPTDAALQLELLRTHRDTLPPLHPQSPTMRALAQLVAHRRRVVGDKVRITNRLTSTLKNYVPQVLPWFQDKDTLIFCDFLSRWPTLKAAPRARRATLAAFFQAHHVRAAAVIATRIQARKSATPLTMDAGVMAPTALLVHALVSQLRVTLPAIKDCDDARAQRAQAPPDCPLCDACPGAGAVFAPRLLGACGAQRARSTSAAARQK
jgi:transposase